MSRAGDRTGRMGAASFRQMQDRTSGPPSDEQRAVTLRGLIAMKSTPEAYRRSYRIELAHIEARLAAAEAAADETTEEVQ